MCEKSRRAFEEVQRNLFKGGPSKIRKRSLSETLQKTTNSIKKKKKAIIKKIEQEVELNRKLKRKGLEQKAEKNGVENNKEGSFKENEGGRK